MENENKENHNILVNLKPLKLTDVSEIHITNLQNGMNFHFLKKVGESVKAGEAILENQNGQKILCGVSGVVKNIKSEQNADEIYKTMIISNDFKFLCVEKPKINVTKENLISCCKNYGLMNNKIEVYKILENVENTLIINAFDAENCFLNKSLYLFYEYEIDRAIEKLKEFLNIQNVKILVNFNDKKLMNLLNNKYELIFSENLEKFAKIYSQNLKNSEQNYSQNNEINLNNNYENLPNFEKNSKKFFSENLEDNFENQSQKIEQNYSQNIEKDTENYSQNINYRMLNFEDLIDLFNLIFQNVGKTNKFYEITGNSLKQNRVINTFLGVNLGEILNFLGGFKADIELFSDYREIAKASLYDIYCTKQKIKKCKNKTEKKDLKKQLKNIQQKSKSIFKKFGFYKQIYLDSFDQVFFNQNLIKGYEKFNNIFLQSNIISVQFNSNAQKILKKELKNL